MADKYRLDALLGQGGMGSVWKAKNLSLDADVAVKLVHGEIANEETTERLEFEAHAAAQLDHPSAVRIFDLGRTELGDPFIVMELLRGESLRDLLDKRPSLPAEEIVPLLLPVASALAAAHDKGIVHRDLKPDNVVLVEQDDARLPKVVDFGIAKMTSGFDKRSTTEGTVLGSPAYMSPEHARGEVDRIGPPSDVWSLGVVLYECLAGRVPFEGKNQLATLRAIVEAQPVSLASLGVADARLSAIVEKALTKDMGTRFPDMRAFGKALAEWAISQGIYTDATGQSITVHWLRPSRTSIHSDAAIAASSEGRAKPVDEGPRPSVVVWQAPGRPRISRSRWVIVAGVGVAAAMGFSFYLAQRVPAVRADARGSRTPETVSDPHRVPAATANTSATAEPASASAAAGASSTAPVAPPPVAVDPRACVEAIFPGQAFEHDAPLEKLCSEDDPRHGASLLRGELARHGFVVKNTTESMRIWGQLSWYELATFAVARGTCCPAGLEALDLPPSVGTCPSLAGALDKLTARPKGDELDAAVAAFREAARCLERGQRLNAGMASPYDYPGPPDGGAESAFRRILDRATARK